MNKFIVVNHPEKWDFDISGVTVISAKDYLTNPEYASLKNARIFNLCQGYNYQSRGYYVSLLAEAREHKPIPTVRNILDIKAPALIRIVSDDLEELIQKSLKDIRSDEFILSIYFGQNTAKKYRDLSAAFHRHFHAPYLRVKFSFNQKWNIQSVKAISENDIPADHFPYIRDFAQAYFSKKRYDKAKENPAAYSLAILVKEGDEAPASEPKALQKFIDAAEEMGFDAEIISPKEFNRLSAFDALFIRQSTHVNNETYRFARKAQSEGIALIDYPDSILKCSNKVYLTELMQLSGIRIPKTMIIHKDNKNKIIETLGLPCVMKLPDSTFSYGVKKAETKEELEAITDTMLKRSELIIGQEYCYTDHDWRIGVLDEKVLYACKYFMARGHWQVYNWKAKKKKDIEGGYESIPLDKVPAEVINIALKSVKLMGKGLYGVDIKEVNGSPMIIEVNDNPNIDSGIEDKILGDQLYIKIIEAFKERIEKKFGIRS